MNHLKRIVVVWLMGQACYSLPAQEPATVLEAARTADFSKFEMMGNSPKEYHRVVASQSYETGGTVDGLFKQISDKLKSDGWKELDGSYVAPVAASASFSKNQFVVTLSLSPVSGDRVMVSLNNLGNVNWNQLPLPKSLKSMYSLPSMASYQSEWSPEKTQQELKAALHAAGWEDFGSAVGSIYFRKAAVKLMAMVTSAPGLAGKTAVQLSSEQLSYVLPIPPSISMLQYTDSQGFMVADTDIPQSKLWDFYRSTLDKQNWKPTTENPIKIQHRDVLIFRNEAKDMIEVAMHEFESKSRVETRYQTAAKVEVLNAAAKNAATKAQEKMQMEKSKADVKESTVLTVNIPNNLKIESQDDKRVELSSTSGTAKKMVASILSDLQRDEWQSKERVSSDILGDWELKKGEYQLQIDFQDPGFIPAKISISVFGAGKLKILRND